MMVGYLAFAAVVTAATLAADPVYRSRRRRNRVLRHARHGCGVCRLRLDLEKTATQENNR